MKKRLVRFEEQSKDYWIVINEIGKYLGKIHTDLVCLIYTEDDTVEEDGYLFFWCHDDLLQEYLER